MIEQLLWPLLQIILPFRWQVCVVDRGGVTAVSITRTYLGAKRRCKRWSNQNQTLMVRRKPV